jgi:hypothetical protein
MYFDSCPLQYRRYSKHCDIGVPIDMALCSTSSAILSMAPALFAGCARKNSPDMNSLNEKYCRF